MLGPPDVPGTVPSRWRSLVLAMAAPAEWDRPATGEVEEALRLLARGAPIDHLAIASRPAPTAPSIPRPEAREPLASPRQWQLRLAVPIASAALVALAGAMPLIANFDRSLAGTSDRPEIPIPAAPSEAEDAAIDATMANAPPWTDTAA